MKVSVEDLYWLAGLLEGEGSFCAPSPSTPNRPVIGVQMTDLDTIEKVCRILNAKYYKTKKYKEHYKDAWFIQIRGKKAVGWMNILKPLMSKRRQEQIEFAISKYVDKNHNRRLSVNDVFELKNSLANGETVSAMSRKYSIARAAIRAIRDGESYKDLI